MTQSMLFCGAYSIKHTQAVAMSKTSSPWSPAGVSNSFCMKRRDFFCSLLQVCLRWLGISRRGYDNTVTGDFGGKVDKDFFGSLGYRLGPTLSAKWP